MSRTCLKRHPVTSFPETCVSPSPTLAFSTDLVSEAGCQRAPEQVEKRVHHFNRKTPSWLQENGLAASPSVPSSHLSTRKEHRRRARSTHRDEAVHLLTQWTGRGAEMRPGLSWTTQPGREATPSRHTDQPPGKASWPAHLAVLSSCN